MLTQLLFFWLSTSCFSLALPSQQKCWNCRLRFRGPGSLGLPGRKCKPKLKRLKVKVLMKENLSLTLLMLWVRTRTEEIQVMLMQMLRKALRLWTPITKLDSLLLFAFRTCSRFHQRLSSTTGTFFSPLSWWNLKVSSLPIWMKMKLIFLNSQKTSTRWWPKNLLCSICYLSTLQSLLYLLKIQSLNRRLLSLSQLFLNTRTYKEFLCNLKSKSRDQLKIVQL